MPEPVSSLMREFLSWLSTRRRTYGEVMDAWRSTCPRHTVWEDALADGLIEIDSGDRGHLAEVILSSRAKAALAGESTARAPASVEKALYARGSIYTVRSQQ